MISVCVDMMFMATDLCTYMRKAILEMCTLSFRFHISVQVGTKGQFMTRCGYAGPGDLLSCAWAVLAVFDGAPVKLQDFKEQTR